MKIFCLPYMDVDIGLDLPEVEHAGKKLYPRVGRPIMLRADTALLNGNKPFFLPLYTQDVVAAPCLAVRVGRMGRSIDEQFAWRYVDGVGVGLSLVARDLLRQCVRRGLPQDVAYSFDGAAPMSKMLSVEHFNMLGDISVVMRLNCSVVDDVALDDVKQNVARAVAYVSRFFLLHTGDIIMLRTRDESTLLHVDDKVCVDINGLELMDFYIR